MLCGHAAHLPRGEKYLIWYWFLENVVEMIVVPCCTKGSSSERCVKRRI